MGSYVPLLAALLGFFSITATAAHGARPTLERGVESTVPATRFEGGKSAHFTVSARIIRQSARIGAGYGAPGPHMVPRATSVSAADGRSAPALVYDFE